VVIARRVGEDGIESEEIAVDVADEGELDQSVPR
jgi:hypothetical protein